MSFKPEWNARLSAAPRSSDPVPRWSSGAAGYLLLRGLQILSFAGRAERPVISCSAVFRSCPSRFERSGRHQLLRGLQILSLAGPAKRLVICCSAVFRSCPSRFERSGRNQLLRGLQILSFAGRAQRQASAASRSSDPDPRGSSGAAGISCSAVFRSCLSRVERSGRHQLLRGLQILSLAVRAERQASAAPRSSDPVFRGSSGAAGISCSAVFRSCPSRFERSGRHQLLRGLQILSLAVRAERQASAAPRSSDPVFRGSSGAAGISCSAVFRSCPSRAERSGRLSAAPRSSDPVPRGLSGAAGYLLLRGLQILSLAGPAERPVICCSAVFRSCPSRVQRSARFSAAPRSSDPVPRGLRGAAGISCSAVFRSCLSRVERSGRHQLLRGLQILSLAG